MVFSSVIFICIFLPVMLIGYYVLPKKVRNLWLLLGSLFFYGFYEPKFLPIIASSVILNYLFGLAVAKFATDGSHNIKQKITVISSLIVNLGALVYFKYFIMLVETANDLFHKGIAVPKIIMPLGISFFTFQSISYVIDVYRTEGTVDAGGNKVTIAEKNFIDYALYITMFPQLIQGPIERYPKMKQALKNPQLSTTQFSKGIERFIIGLAKKALLADTIGEVAEAIFTANTNTMATSVAWLGAICYTIQIYYDFSGYTDMAIGLGKLFGFDFSENFNYPYISKSITEFWRRWHISLSSWFKDYLYIPLGGNRTGNVYVNLLIVFLATGIWHGADWGFVVWGLWHGVFMLIERFLKGRSVGFKLPGFFKWLYTMLAVTLGWVLFKIEDLADAMDYFAVMFHTKAHEYIAFDLGFYLDKKLIFLLIVAVIAAIPWAQVLPRYPSVYIAKFTLAEGNALCIVRRVILIALFVLSLIFVVNSTYSPFIYFKF